ncbi:gliding motility-associated C-terminal domain-containing protein [Flavobacterium sp. '19STA2R22 D10 B1']|uniref:Ig-like domain-containing protein n=1 Tax=Flavobacterium aerium TaxID=3037261 RepID=UPI00278BD380|nr:gliding motility-associated C-terminal domain-containing protein [Flavobacterium sp. '19STA2R22 D10 B1']
MKTYFTIKNLTVSQRFLGLLLLLMVFSNSYAQNVCRPTSQTNSQAGVLCIGMSIVDPGKAIDNDPTLTTYASLTNAVGLLCFVEETFVLNQTAKAGDQVVIYFTTGNGVLDVSLLSNVSLQGKFNGTDVGPVVPLNSPLLNLNLLSANGIAQIKYTVPNDTNQIKIQVGGLLNLLVNLKIYDVRLDFVKPTIVGGASQTVCLGQSTTLSATAAAGTSIAWYSSLTSTTPLSTTGSYTTPNLTTQTTYYVSVSRNAGCEGDERTPVVVDIINPIAPAISTVGTAICSATPTQSTTLSVVNPVLGTSYSWFTTSTGGVALQTGNTYSPTVALGVTTYYVEASIGLCKSATRTQVNVTATAIPALPTVLTQSVTIQSGQNATLTATTSEPGVVIDWYDVPTGGSALINNSNTFTTPILTATKTYYVEANHLTTVCVSPTRVPITVTVLTGVPANCLAANSQQTNQNGLCLFCGSTNPDYSVDNDNNTAARITVPVGLITGWIQQTLQFSTAGKVGDIIDVELGIPGGLLDLGVLSYITLGTYNGATYNNDRVAINNPLLNVQLLAGGRFRASFVAGATFDRIEIRLGGLASVLTSLDIYGATYRFKAPTISGNATICNGQSTTLTAAAGLGETINWYDAMTGGTLLSNTAAYTTPTLNATTTYYVEITRGSCVNSERLPVQVTVNNPIAPVVDALGTNICAGQTTTLTIPSPVVGTTYNWYDAATAGTLLGTGTSFTTLALTADKSYYVEAVIGTCISPTRTPVNVVVKPLPLAPTVASQTVTIQSGQSVVLQVSSAEAGVVFDWYTTATGGSPIATATSTYTTPSLTVNTTYYVGTRNLASGCTSSTRTVINVIVISTPAGGCLTANSQIPNQNGICLACGVTNDGDSVDGNNNTAAHLSIPVGLLGGWIQQTLLFGSTGRSGDIIEVELGIPTGLIDVSALSYISLATYNGVNFNNDRTPINSGLLNVQLLTGNRFKVSFIAGATFDRVEVRLGGLATLLTALDIYGASYRYPALTVTGATAPICAGQTATLIATVTGGDIVNWYDVPSGGVALATNTATFTTPTLNATTTYYIEVSRAGCINSIRQAVTVNVLSIPIATDVTIASSLTASCAGDIVLTPTTTVVGGQFKYYTTQLKTQEITTGYAGHPGVTYLKNPTTGSLTISGLNATGTPYNYYVSVAAGGLCENEINTLKQVTVNFPASTVLDVTTPLSGCAKVNLKDAILNFDITGNTTYTFFDASNNPITAQVAANITTGGIYYIQAQANNGDCPSVKKPVTVVVNPLPTLTVSSAPLVVNIGSTVILNATSNAPFVWYDSQGNVSSNVVGPFTAAGFYTFTVIASNGTCSVSATVLVNVIDPDSCPLLTERVYASMQSSGSIITGGVTNGPAAVDGNPQTYSTITTGLGLLGIGTTWQNLQWTNTIAKGTPVTVKLGSAYSGVTLAGGVSIVGTKRDGLGNPIDIGVLQSISGSLLNLLSGQNTFEFTFVPSNTSGPQDYDGIRISSGALLSVAQNTNVYDAYYDQSVSTITCGQGDIEDIFYGAVDLGIGALTATVGVTDAWKIADNDVSTYATMFTGVGVLAAADLTVSFRTPTIVGDTLRLVVSKPGTVLGVNLLTGFSIQRFLGNVEVGAPINNTSTLLSIKLLSGGSMAMVIVFPQAEPYDRVRIRLGGVAGVLDYLRVHSIDRVTNTKVVGGDINNKVIACPGDPITLEVPPDACANYIWYDSPIGGNVVANGPTYFVSATLSPGIHKFYVQPVRYGCEALSRGEVTVEIKATTPVNTVASVTINGGTSTTICAEDGNVTLLATLNALPVLTNPVYHWYSFNGTTSTLIVGQTTPQLAITGLVPGTYTYFVGVSSDEYCETAEPDRKSVTFTILPFSNTDDITVNNASICQNQDAILTPSSTLLNPVFSWYLDNNKTQPIINGAVIGGITYTVSATGVLTAAGLTSVMSPVTYYVAVASDNTCPNKNGELKIVTVIVTDPATPTTDDTTQDFCQANGPTIASIQVNEPNVVWYNVPTGGTALVSTTPLISGTYYAALVDAGTSCESSVRLLVTVTVTDPVTPTTTNDTQDFCQANNPTVASIQVNEPNVVWYNAPTGGAIVAPGTALVSGTYYAVLVDATTGCESSIRLLVTVIVNDAATPTTTDTTQDFCQANDPTVASIQVNDPGVIWYSTPTGGTALVSTTPLVSGTYYGALVDAITGCESSVRLAVTVTVNDTATPTTTDTTQDFCQVTNPTVANIQVNEPSVIWYDVPTGGTALASTTALASGTYYGVLVDAITGCESSVRLVVTVIVNDAATPTTTDTTQDFCLANNPTVASIQVNEPDVIWYGTPTGGTALASTTALANGIYYGALVDATTGCESSVRLMVTVTVNDAATPTTTDTTQDFCQVTNPTIASIQANEPGVIWYGTPTGGTALVSTTALANGIYYGALVDATTGCESSIRLMVTVTVNDAATPTTTDTTQDFCEVTNPTVASIQVNEPGVIWYNVSTGGTALASTTALANGIYYGALVDATTGCESSVRLVVTVTVNDAATPTTTDTTQDFCLVNSPTVASIQVNEPGVIWYSTPTGGTALASTTALASGIYYGALVDATTGCESSVRLVVTVTVNDTATPTTTDTTQDFCQVTNPTIASIQANEPGVIWYNVPTGGTALASTTALASGIYYGALVDAITGCESSVRLVVTVTVNDAATPTTTDTTQDFCQVSNPTVASIQANEPGVIWYSTPTGGIALVSTTALVSGTYYGALVDATTGCESSVRLVVTVTVNDAATPTTTDTTQDFCLANNPTVASIQANEPGVIWYSTPTGGTALASTTALVSGIYYGALVDATTGCESSVRLVVTVTVNDAATPTTTDTTQDFCQVNNPTVASIQANEPGVIWYSTPTGGTALVSTTALASGTYYGALVDAITGCESSVRLMVTVTVNDAATPTTTDATQDFCQTTNPTVASIQANEPGVIWYSTPTGGTALASTTPLVSGIYYGAIVTGGCESSVRLVVTVTITNPATPTTNDTTQDFCQITNPTVASIQVNEPGVVWYSTPTGGIALASTTLLVSGTYYGAIVTGGCESSVRLVVTVTITDGPTPTTTDTTQDFCQATNPIVSSIQTNEIGVIWYNTPTGGTALASTTPLVSGIYYGALVNAITGCESSIRLVITVTVTDAATPTTTDTTQDFCQDSNPTVANIQVNQSNVVWYSTPTGGTALASNTLLIEGTYYAALVDATTGCESSIRLAVVVNFFDQTNAVITGGDGSACVFEQVTYTTTAGMSDYVWVVDGGTVISGGSTVDNTITISWTNIGAASVSVSYTNVNGCNNDTFGTLDLTVATCSDITITKTVDNPTPLIDDNVVFTIKVNNVGSGQFINLVVTELLPNGYAFVSASTSTGTYNQLSGFWSIPTLNAGQTATLTVTVKVLPTGEYLNTASITTSTPVDLNGDNNEASATVDPLCLIVYNEFTPNGDGSNDNFKIDCIEKYPDNTLEIFNRYGNLVYKTRGYTNNWQGTINVKDAIIGNDNNLPTGTYYYVLDTGDGITKKGWVYIMR